RPEHAQGWIEALKGHGDAIGRQITEQEQQQHARQQHDIQRPVFGEVQRAPAGIFHAGLWFDRQADVISYHAVGPPGWPATASAWRRSAHARPGWVPSARGPTMLSPNSLRPG